MPTEAALLPPNILDLSPRDWEKEAQGAGAKSFHGKNGYRWALERGARDFEAMTDLPAGFRQALSAKFKISYPTINLERISSDQRARKLLVGFPDGAEVECVVLKPGPRKTFEADSDSESDSDSEELPPSRRVSLCVSTQSGCAVACPFCATGLLGLRRNLTAGEILGQVLLARHQLKEDLTHVVFMGMGEPLMNWPALEVALEGLTGPGGLGLSGKRVTVSTSGYLPGMEKLKEADPAVVMAISLHAPDDALRNELVPINKKWPIASILDWCRSYLEGHKRRKITFEYVLLDKVNDSVAQARDLVRILHGLPSKVNLIPFNPIPGMPYGRSTPQAVEAFQTTLLQGGIRTMLRDTLGADIDAACGQLFGKGK